MRYRHECWLNALTLALLLAGIGVSLHTRSAWGYVFIVPIFLVGLVWPLDYDYYDSLPLGM